MNRAPSLCITAAVIAGLSLLATACGGSASSKVAQLGSTTTRSAANPSAASGRQSGALAFSRCMRSHGVPKFPDLPVGGKSPPAQQLGVDASRLQAAESACIRLLPPASDASVMQCFETGNCPPPLLQRLLNGMREFARCMRAHGTPGWPDPTVAPGQGPGFDLLHVHGFDPNSSQIEDKLAECTRLLPGVRVALERP